ncbi:MAG: hypothetical protein EOP37_22490 [Rubrivivax sp.]|nr:MAG: hypothetical protein EOP37_22490 [Rubrivivax sp.]
MTGKGDAQVDPSVARLRVTLEFRRSDDPQLFDALTALPKGRRRVARLRTLAHDGLRGAAAQAHAADLVVDACGGEPSLRTSTLALEQGVRPGKEHHSPGWPDASVTAGVFDDPLTE